MPAGNAGRRYAQAVFDIAKTDNQFDQWTDDLQLVAQALTEPAARNYLENPKINREKKQAYVQEVLKGRITPAALNLAALLVQRGRQDSVETLRDEFVKMVNRLRGIEIATVTTAVPITEAEETQIKARLTEITGKQVQITKKVDPNIIGGVVAQVGDTLIDGSVASRLQALKRALV